MQLTNISASMRLLAVWALLFLISKNAAAVEMTEKQLQAAAKVIKNVCQPKSKVSNAIIDAAHKGEFPDNPALMCYMECTTRMAKILKNNKLDYDSMVARVKELPKARQELTLASLETCKDSATSDDKCMAGYQVYKCIYESNPDNFFLP